MDQIQIADYLAKKVFNRELTEDNYYIMLKNKQLYSVSNYGLLLESYEISPEDAFVYINFNNYYVIESYRYSNYYLFPLIDLGDTYGIVDSYLSKWGFYNPKHSIYPATGLKYYAAVKLFSDRLMIEVVDIDTVATNTRLEKIVVDVLGKYLLTKKKVSINQINEIERKLHIRKLFAGHNWSDAYKIIFDYYEYHKTSLAKEVLSITDAYNRIFQPYRVVYDTTTRQQVLM